ncbi:uncharacterized protein LTR77_008939 [Saxophila tyrrhenica]|uniref:Ubiquitin-like protease family profile domain-containing protein n=1 Tax=Saxophila tyrrhenica TaxID=1690608 RepID=A0AAV9NZ49_9PEZI|nr:hypothetical protein LTR77_008939 [Saxophila tyrrhenica]
MEDVMDIDGPSYDNYTPSWYIPNADNDIRANIGLYSNNNNTTTTTFAPSQSATKRSYSEYSADRDNITTRLNPAFSRNSVFSPLLIFSQTPPKRTPPKGGRPQPRSILKKRVPFHTQAIPAIEPQEEARDPSARTVSGMITTIYTTATSYFSALWGYITNTITGGQEQQNEDIRAIESNSSGTKRRAVSSPSAAISSPPTLTTAQQQVTSPSGMPGSFPQTQTAQLETPPSSRPSSSGSDQEKKHDSPTEDDSSKTSHPPQEQDDAPSNPPTHHSATDSYGAAQVMPQTKQSATDGHGATPVMSQTQQSATDGHGATHNYPRIRNKYACITPSSPLDSAQPSEPVDFVLGQMQKKKSRKSRLPPEARKWKPRPYFSTQKAESSSTPAENNQNGDPPRSITEAAVRNKLKDLIVDERVKKVQVAIDSPARRELSSSWNDRKKLKETQRREKEAEEAAQQWARDEEEARQVAEAEDLARQIEDAEKGYESEEAEPIIPTLSKAWQARVDEEMSTKDHRKRIATDASGTDLTRHDFGTLIPQAGSRDNPSGWLNDEIVNAWFGRIVAAKRDPNSKVKVTRRGAPSSHQAHSSMWYNTYKNSGISGMKGWSRNWYQTSDQFFATEKVYFPINTGAHWTLLVVSPRTRSIEYLDSLGGNGGHFVRIAREWIQMELAKFKLDYVEDEWRYALEFKSGLQCNSNDCGAFTCLNGMASAQGRKGYEALGDCEKELGMGDGRRFMAAVLMNGGFQGEFLL